MAIRDIPGTPEDVEQFFDAYEAEHLAYSEEGQSLMEATKVVVADWFPRPLVFLADPFTRVLLGDEVGRYVGQKPAPMWAQRLVRSLLALRRLALRYLPIGPRPLITPGDAVGPYKQGYSLDDLGARTAVAEPSGSVAPPH